MHLEKSEMTDGNLKFEILTMSIMMCLYIPNMCS